MTYTETLNWLYNQLPMFQNVGATAYKKDLTNTIALTNYLGNPETQFKSIHVAGTNGKGSTSSMLASVFMEAGYKVGLYTSPHLKDFRERITINGRPISKAYVQKFVEQNKSFFENHS
jgi:dihydrofolate synthase/folylpolyglutamate synthase